LLVDFAAVPCTAGVETVTGIVPPEESSPTKHKALTAMARALACREMVGWIENEERGSSMD
jgi:hypothetical protein